MSTPKRPKRIATKAATPPAPSFVLVTNHDDWMGLYVNGVLFTEGHDIRPRDLLAAAGIELETVEPDGEWLYECGHLPQKLSEVKRREEESS